MATQSIFQEKNINRMSKLIGAANIGFEQAETSVMPTGQFGFTAIIETDKTKLKSTSFDFEYDIPFDDDIVPNEAEIKIYNLTDDTISNFKKDNMVTITAGYGTDTGIILRGKISKVKTVFKDCDKITTIYVLDNFNYTDGYIVEETFSENTKASYILKTLLDKVGLPVNVFEIKRDHTYTSTTTVKGSITENIKTYANVCGVGVWVNKQGVYCQSICSGENISFTVCSKTGMIGSPEPYEESGTYEEYKDTVVGYTINMLAQHRMTTAAIVNVDSKNCNGAFRVCSGSHSYDGLSATTTIKCIEKITTEIVQTDGTSSSKSTSGVINKAIQWAVDIAKDNSHSYSQEVRWGPHYDCSSFAISAYQQAGLSVKEKGASYTGNMYDAFIACGFEDVTSSCNLSDGTGMKKGDVLLNKVHHAALVQKNGGTTVEARNTSYGIVADVTYRNYPWDCVLRYSKDNSVDSNGKWITGHMATTYGNTSSDDNGICGWNGLNYHNISGCHVAIPTYCIKQASCYNSIWANDDFPELANGYGTVLEVRSPDTGRTVKAVVADCGNFGPHNKYNHETALDLPPNTYNALGLSPGKHSIEYRVVGSVKSWNGEQLV